MKFLLNILFFVVFDWVFLMWLDIVFCIWFLRCFIVFGENGLLLKIINIVNDNNLVIYWWGKSNKKNNYIYINYFENLIMIFIMGWINL